MARGLVLIKPTRMMVVGRKFVGFVYNEIADKKLRGAQVNVRLGY